MFHVHRALLQLPFSPYSVPATIVVVVVIVALIVQIKDLSSIYSRTYPVLHLNNKAYQEVSSSVKAKTKNNIQPVF
jgi:hypothetical protein